MNNNLENPNRTVINIDNLLIISDDSTKAALFNKVVENWRDIIKNHNKKFNK